MKDKQEGEEKSNFSSLLFGNVNKDGELETEDDPFFDRQLRKDLDTFTKKTSYFNIKSIGVDDKDTTSSTATTTAEQDGSNKLRSAVDYEDIDELAVEDVNNAENIAYRKQVELMKKNAQDNIAMLAVRYQNNSINTNTLYKPPPLFKPPSSILTPPPLPTSTISKPSNKRKLEEEDDYDYDNDQPQQQQQQIIQQQQPTKLIVEQPIKQKIIEKVIKEEEIDYDKEEEEIEREEEQEDDESSETSESSESSELSDESQEEEEEEEVINYKKLRKSNRKQRKQEEEEEYDELQTTESILSKKKKPIKKFKPTMNAVLETVKHLMEKPSDFTANSVEFKTFCSANSPGGPILRFSNLFAPKLPSTDLIRKRSRRVKTLPKLELTNDLVDQDDLLLFNSDGLLDKKDNNQNQNNSSNIIGSDGNNIQSPTLTSSNKSSSNSMMMMMMGIPDVNMLESEKKEYRDYNLRVLKLHQLQQQNLQDEENLFEPLHERQDQDSMDSYYSVNDTTFESLEQLDWEDKIIIDNEDNDSSSNIITSTTTTTTPPLKQNVLKFSFKNNNQLQLKQKSNQYEQLLNQKNIIISKSIDLDNLSKNQSKSNIIEIQDHQQINGESIIDKQLKDNQDLDKDNNNNNNYWGTINYNDNFKKQEKNQISDLIIESNNNNNLIVEKKEPVSFKSNIVENWSLFPIRNQDLEKGEWVNEIIWDESSIDYKPKVSQLILDLNDHDMLFEEHVIRKQKELNQQTTESNESNGDNTTDPTIDKPVSKKGKSKKKLLLLQQQAELAKSSAAALQQQMSGLDKFNLSNDKFYKQIGRNRVRQQSGKALVQHALPAIKLSLVKTHLTIEDLRYAHRPRILFPISHSFHIVLYDSIQQQQQNNRYNHHHQNHSSKSDPSMKHKIDLSAREGRIILVEYIEQFPSLINNIGMGSRIRNFYRKKDPNDTQLEPFDDGEKVLLDANDGSPFLPLGDIPTGSTVQSIVNNLFKVPIAKQTTSPNDFLLVRSRDGKRWYIREITTIYTAGQLLPEVEVPAPNSRGANMFLRGRLQSFIYRLFLKKSNPQKRLKISDVCNAFPSQSEASIRKRLKDCSDFQRGGDDSGWWTVKDNFPLPTEEELQKLVTPESVCSYESMLVGLQRLQECGVIHFTNPGTIPATLVNLDENDPLRAKCKPVEDVLNQTPWNLTSNFITSIQGKIKLQLVTDDPNQKEFSFLKIPQKIANQKQKQPKTIAQKSQVTGTDADLRKLSLKESEIVLLKMGVSMEVIKSLSRWKRIALVRKKSSEAALNADNEGAMTKFARGSRYSMDHQQLQYKEQCQSIFDSQLKLIAGNGTDDDIEMDDFDDLEKELEDNLFQQNTEKSQNPDDDDVDEDEREEYNKLMNEVNDTKQDKKLQDEDEKLEEDEQEQKNLIEYNQQQQATSTTSTNNNNEDIEMMNSLANMDPSEIEYIKRVTLFQKPDGSLYRRIEVIRDPKIIGEYRRRRDVLIKNGVLFEEEDLKKQKKKLQEKLRKLKNSGPTSATNQPQTIQQQNSPISFNSVSINQMNQQQQNYKLQQSPNIQELPTTPLTTSSTKIKIPLVRSSNDDLDNSPSLSHSGSLIVRLKKDDLPPLTASQRKKLLLGNKGYNNKLSDAEMVDLMMDQPNFTLTKSSRRNRIRKDGAGADVELSNVFEKVIEKLRGMDEFTVFRHKVTPKIAPDYHLIIKNPIDLTTLRDRNRLWEYKTKQQFLDALRLMVTNCYEYNEKRNPHLIPLAEKMYSIGVNTLEEYSNEIEEIEKSVNQTTPSLSNPATPSSPTMHEFNVDSPFFPPISSMKDEEDIDIVSISGVSPSTAGNY